VILVAALRARRGQTAVTNLVVQQFNYWLTENKVQLCCLAPRIGKYLCYWSSTVDYVMSCDLYFNFHKNNYFSCLASASLFYKVCSRSGAYTV